MKEFFNLLGALTLVGLWFLAGYLLSQVMDPQLATAIVMLVWLHK